MSSIFDKPLAQTATMPLVYHDTNKVLTMPDDRVQHIVIAGDTSPEYKEWEKLNNEHQKQEIYAESGIARRKKRSTMIDSDELEMRMLLSVIKGWLIDDGDGGELEYNEGNIRKVFGNPAYQEYKEDVIVFCRQRDNYRGEFFAA